MIGNGSSNGIDLNYFNESLFDEKTKDDQIAGYMQAVYKLLSIHDNQFRELINYSNEG